MPRSKNEIQKDIEWLSDDFKKTRDGLRVANRAHETNLQKQRELNEELSHYGQDITVSDHVMIRFLERHHGLNVEEIGNKILTPEVRGMIKFAGGNSTVKAFDGKFIVKNNVVVTFIPNK